MPAGDGLGMCLRRLLTEGGVLRRTDLPGGSGLR